MLRDKRIRGRDAGFATELRYGATRLHGLYDADHRRGRRAPRRPDRRQRPRHPAPRRPPAARHARGRPRRRRRDGRRWRGRSTAPVPAGFVNAVMRRISERDLPTLGRRGRAHRATRSPGWRPAAAHPEWIVRALRAALLGHGASTAETVDADLDGPARGRQRARQGLPRRPARPGRRRRARRGRRRRARGSHRSGRSSPAATRAASPPSATDARRCRTRARSWWPSRWQPCRGADRADGASAGWTCAPAPAARRRCSPRWPRRRAPTLIANEVSEHRADLVRQTLRRGAIGAGVEVDGRHRRRPRRSARTSPGATTGCSSTRRAPGWARCAAAPRRAGVARPRDLADLGRAAARAAASALDATAARRRRRLRHVHPAPGRDPVRRRRRAQEARRTSSVARRAAAVHRRAGRAGPAPRRRARTSSCGRTCTAPTRCSSPCCARPDGGAAG